MNLKVLLMIAAIAASGYLSAQSGTSMAASMDFSLNVESKGFIKESHYQILVTFVVPTYSDEVLSSEILKCKGWMPGGAAIDTIHITDIKGLPEGSTWECRAKNCSWAGGVTGTITITTLQPPTSGLPPVTAHIKGLGSLYGISKWYECRLQIDF